MSASQPKPPGEPPGAAVDPSMEDILASIRRILSDDEAAPAPPAAPALATAKPPPPPSPISTSPISPPVRPMPPPIEHVHDDVLKLDPSMLVEEPVHAGPPSQADLPPPPPPRPVAVVTPPKPLPPPPPLPAHDATLVAPETAAAAASSVGDLVRTLIAEREQVAVYRSGPTIEDLVREEIRPIMKQWLDTHLPPLVERLVRAEIERVIHRTTS